MAEAKKPPSCGAPEPQDAPEATRGPARALAALQATAERIRLGTAPPPQSPRELAWQDIETIPDLFQHRRCFTDASEKHVQTLARAIKRGPRGPKQNALAPITVYWVGDAWGCVDGHHRLKAYELVGHATPVPVTVLSGVSLEEATRAALRANGQDAMPLTPRCRTEAAWGLTLEGGLSKDEIATLAGVDTSSVAGMRRAIREFRAAHPQTPPESLTWAQMRMWKKGAPAPDGKDPEQRAAERLLRLTEKHIKDVSPRVLLLALELHSPGLVAELVREHRISNEIRFAYGPDTALPFPVVEPEGNPDF